MPANANTVNDAAKEFARELEAAADNLDQDAVELAAVEALKPVAEDARTNAPVDTGTLRDSIEINRFSRIPRDLGEDFVGGAVVGGVFYGLFVEIGANQPAQPWLRPAFDTNREEIANRFAESLEESMFEDFG